MSKLVMTYINENGKIMLDAKVEGMGIIEAVGAMTWAYHEFVSQARDKVNKPNDIVVPQFGGIVGKN